MVGFMDRGLGQAAGDAKVKFRDRGLGRLLAATVAHLWDGPM